MILPDRHTRPENSLLVLGSQVLGQLRRACTVSELWERSRSLPGMNSFHMFTLTLAFLYAIGAIDHVNRLIARRYL